MNKHVEDDLNVLIKRRREEHDELKQKGIETYAYSFDVNAYANEIKENFEDDTERTVAVAGRIMAIRRMGKASFTHIQDKTGRIQLYLKRDEIGQEQYQNFKLMDIGDIVGARGFVFRTRTGEISVHVKEFVLLAKSVRPLPIPKEVVDEDGNKKVFDQFADKELRYRQRYVDLILNNDVREVFIKRFKIINAMREYLNDNGLIEVETPALQPLYGGAAARPFTTHHNALDIPLYLRIADELYLKRLIVGGFDGVYEISKDFRNEGMDKNHNPEFTMMECYVAFKDYEWMMTFVENLFDFIAKKVFGTTVFDFDGKKIDFKAPWKRLSLVDSLSEKIGQDILKATDEDLRAIAKKMELEVTEKDSRATVIDELFGALIEHELEQPTFVMDYPVETSPLAKKHRSKEGVVERFEGFVAGKEICNAFSELNDPFDQRERFEMQAEAKAKGDEEAHMIDEDYIRALEYGMPPTAGLGIGVDRIVMLLTGQPSIRDVLLFPLMRPEK